MSTTEKRCSKCGETKELGEFSWSKRDAERGGLGYEAGCKECKREYREANRDQIAEYKRAYREANRDKVVEKSREYREANRDQIAEKSREYYEANRDRLSEYYREYREANRDRIVEHQREYYEANRDQPWFKEAKRALVRKRRALKQSLPSERVILRDVTRRDGAHCWMCGDELSEYNPGHLDHLVPIKADGGLLAAWGLENPGTVLANMALACPPCNIRKSNRVMPCALARYMANLNAESVVAA